MGEKKIITKLPYDASQVAKSRSLGGKRCVRFSISTPNEYDNKLSKLATSCGMTKSKMADTLLRLSLDSPSLIDEIQNLLNTNEQYRVRPLIINNRVVYDEEDMYD
ncbi:hypothetical protein U8V72_11280 [Priestia filamentosa]|uniref:hypothetical protein n=1 Tax=Priestia filamentosa TaxID=1402861 RepID=UPI000589636B